MPEQCMDNLRWTHYNPGQTMLPWMCVHSLGPVMVEQASAY